MNNAVSKVVLALLVLIVANFIIFNLFATTLLAQLLVSALVIVAIGAIASWPKTAKSLGQKMQEEHLGVEMNNSNSSDDLKETQQLDEQAMNLSNKVDSYLASLANTRLELGLRGASAAVMTAADNAINQLFFLLPNVKLTASGSETALEAVWKKIDSGFNQPLRDYIIQDAEARVHHEKNLIERLTNVNAEAQELAENGFINSFIDLSLTNPKPSSDRQRSVDYLEVIRNLPPLVRTNKGVEAIKQGDHILFLGNLFVCDEVSFSKETWEGKTYKWYEVPIKDFRTGVTQYLEWSRDDELEISISTDKFNLSELGCSRERLELIRENEEGSIRYAGTTYHYDDDGEATFHRGGAKAGEKFEYIDFESSSGREFLGVEFWGSTEVQVHLSKKVNQDSFQIFQIVSAAKEVATQ